MKAENKMLKSDWLKIKTTEAHSSSNRPVRT